MKHYQFKPSLGMTIATIIVMAICIRLGFWQYNKAQTKIQAQQQLDKGLAGAPVKLPEIIEDKDKWRYKRVTFKGQYIPEYQFLLDNRVHNGKAGYHVITPVKLVGDERLVLVNRGWIAGYLDRTMPTVDTPIGETEFLGDIFFPLDKVFSLEAESTTVSGLEPVWQHINLTRYQQSVPFKVKPFMVRLAAESDASGFVRAWPVPKSRVTIHLGYAYQWFGFAFTLFVIFIVLNLKKVKKESN